MCNTRKLAPLALVGWILLSGNPAAAQAPGVNDLEELASKFEKSVAARDVDALAGLLDLKAMLLTATRDVPVDERIRDAFISSTQQRILQAGFPLQLMNSVANGGEFTFLRIQNLNGEPRLLFRLLTSPGSGVNYHHYIAAKSGDGKSRIVDFNNLLNGMRLTDGLRLGYLSLLQTNDPGLWMRLKGIEQSYVQLLPRIEAINLAMQSGKFDDAFAEIDALPDTFRHNKLILQTELAAAKLGRPERMLSVVESYRTSYPGEPTADLLAIDAFGAVNKYQEALEAANRVDRAVGGDPFLDVLRARLLLSLDQRGRARQLATRLMEQHPGWLSPYWTLAEVSIQENMYPETLGILKQIDERFEVTFNDLRQLPVYEAFRAAPEHETWREHLERRTLPPQRGPRPSADECVLWATQYVRAIAAGDAASANRLFDWEHMLARATLTRSASLKFLSNFRKGFTESLDRKGFCYEVIQSKKGGGNYRRMNVDAAETRGQVLFRLLLPASNSRFNYHRFQLHKLPDGSIRCADIGILFTGELLSQTMRQSFLLALMQSAGRADVGLTENENLRLQALPGWKQMQALSLGGKPRDALQFYDRLPPEIQTNREVLLARAECSFPVGAAEYAAALNALRETFPNDPSIAMATIFGYLQLEDYVAAMECVGLLEQSVGSDAYLDVLRANIYRLDENPRKAREAADAALAREPDLPDANWIRLQVSLDEKDYPRTVELLTVLEGKLNVPLGELTTFPAFSDFVQSPHYAAWKMKRPKK